VVEGDEAARRYAIGVSCRAKARIVGADERESGARALLNLGHTFGHALEAECGYSDELLHGEAVAIGMVLAFDLSATLGLCPPEDAARVQRHLASVGLPTSPLSLQGRIWSVERLIEHMGRDKKVRDGPYRLRPRPWHRQDLSSRSCRPRRGRRGSQCRHYGVIHSLNY
jgi:3-dehydroquinate synthase